MSGSTKRAPMMLMTMGFAGALAIALPVTAQTSEADSVRLLDRAKEAQAAFERFREQRIPPERGRRGGGCDEIIGRICLTFGDPENSGTNAADEPVEFGMARTKVMREFKDIADDIPGDRWVLGQRVFYLLERGSLLDAERLAERCGGGSNWWCTALLGMVTHAKQDWIEAERIFDQAIAEMPPEEALAFQLPEYILEEEGVEFWEENGGAEVLEDRLWILSDPLYLVEGNDRKTEQYSRQVLSRIREEAENPYGLAWGDDLMEIDLRYGAETGWGRQRQVPNGSLQDTRSIMGFMDPRSQEFMPPAKAVISPADVLSGEWKLEQLKPHTGYVAPYAPALNALETQVARFRRGDSLLVVGAFAPLDPSRRPEFRERIVFEDNILDLREARNRSREDRQRDAGDPFGRGGFDPEPFPGTGEAIEEESGPIESALFLVGEDAEVVHEVHGEGSDGAFRLQVPNGRYIVGIEAFDEAKREAWRDRHGLWQDQLFEGIASISDILVLRGGGDNPNSVDEAMATAMPAVRIREGDAFKLVWELYGLKVGETAQVRIGVEEGGANVLQRAARFFGLGDPDRPVVMSWEDAGPDVHGTVFRAVELNLPDIEPGDYTLTVQIQLPGREPMTARRPIVIEP